MISDTDCPSIILGSESVNIWATLVVELGSRDSCVFSVSFYCGRVLKVHSGGWVFGVLD